MDILKANVSHELRKFIQHILQHTSGILELNSLIYSISGIVSFLDNEEELDQLKDKFFTIDEVLDERNKIEYGDFQTNSNLSFSITQKLSKGINEPDVVIEPTCGKGNFIIAALKTFKQLKKVYGIEIFKPYVWETKFSILDLFLKNPNLNKPDIFIHHHNVFDFDFNSVIPKFSGNSILILGNPPWVTNSTLGLLKSSNLPEKSNFKKFNGLDAITGKGNFDIAEYITMMMLDIFHHNDGTIALLVKNSVVKNIIFDQAKNMYHISSIEKHCIDSKKEFGVSVAASLFYCKLNTTPEFDCTEFDFYQSKHSYQKFGWLDKKFVSNIETYAHTKHIDGESPFIWRQGLKHDCSSIMELDKVNEHYVNGLKEEINLEDGLVYGILKSSDLKNTVINQTRKFTIVTQKKVGQETNYIKFDYPKTYQYLIEHIENFSARKSSIYNNKPLFSIFGIGDYSFKPYKVAISGLYKTFHFTLILPQNDKPVMLDDTCYLIGFDKIEFAVYALILLNSNMTVQLLQSVTFSDAKRTFTKDVLMRIDLSELAKRIDKSDLQSELRELNEKYNLNLTLNLWDNFIRGMTPIDNRQMKIFV